MFNIFIRILISIFFLCFFQESFAVDWIAVLQTSISNPFLYQNGSVNYIYFSSGGYLYNFNSSQLSTGSVIPSLQNTWSSQGFGDGFNQLWISSTSPTFVLSYNDNPNHSLPSCWGDSTMYLFTFWSSPLAWGVVQPFPTAQPQINNLLNGTSYIPFPSTLNNPLINGASFNSSNNTFNYTMNNGTYYLQLTYCYNGYVWVPNAILTSTGSYDMNLLPSTVKPIYNSGSAIYNTFQYYVYGTWLSSQIYQRIIWDTGVWIPFTSSYSDSPIISWNFLLYRNLSKGGLLYKIDLTASCIWTIPSWSVTSLINPLYPTDWQNTTPSANCYYQTFFQGKELWNESKVVQADNLSTNSTLNQTAKDAILYQTGGIFGDSTYLYTPITTALTSISNILNNNWFVTTSNQNVFTIQVWWRAITVEVVK